MMLMLLAVSPMSVSLVWNSVNVDLFGNPGKANKVILWHSKGSARDQVVRMLIDNWNNAASYLLNASIY